MKLSLWALMAVAAWGQSGTVQERASSSAARCGQVRQTIQVIEAAKAPLPDDLKTARDACQAARGQDGLAKAGVTLDRLNLTPAELFVRMDQASSGLTGLVRFYMLAALAKQALVAGKPDKAQKYARELLQMASDSPEDWNYGNALYYGYFVLGRVALEQGNTELAGRYLMNAATTPGSPQLNSFGPNMTLAKELLEHRQFTVVEQFLTQCKNFWKLDHGNLDSWIGQVRRGEIPEFGANLDF